MTTQSDEPRPERVLSWAEVYSSGDCGGCAKTDCPHCAARFLQFLRSEGASRTSDAKGLT